MVQSWIHHWSWPRNVRGPIVSWLTSLSRHYQKKKYWIIKFASSSTYELLFNKMTTLKKKLFGIYVVVWLWSMLISVNQGGWEWMGKDGWEWARVDEKGARVDESGKGWMGVDQGGWEWERVDESGVWTKKESELTRVDQGGWEWMRVGHSGSEWIRGQPKVSRFCSCAPV